MEIKIQPAAAGQRRSKPADETKLVFGKTFSDHMFMMDYFADQGGWQNPRIVPYQNLVLDPAAMVAIARGDLSRTLKTMSRYGLVKLVRFDRQVRPVADAERYQIVA